MTHVTPPPPPRCQADSARHHVLAYRSLPRQVIHTLHSSPAPVRAARFPGSCNPRPNRISETCGADPVCVYSEAPPAAPAPHLHATCCGRFYKESVCRAACKRTSLHLPGLASCTLSPVVSHGSIAFILRVTWRGGKRGQQPALRNYKERVVFPCVSSPSSWLSGGLGAAR